MSACRAIRQHLAYGLQGNLARAKTASLGIHGHPSLPCVRGNPRLGTLLPRSPQARNNRVAARELKLSYHNPDNMSFAMYGNFS